MPYSSPKTEELVAEAYREVSEEISAYNDLALTAVHMENAEPHFIELYGGKTHRAE